MLPTIQTKIDEYLKVQSDDVIHLTASVIRTIENSLLKAIKLFCPLMTPLASVHQLTDYFLTHLDTLYTLSGDDGINVYKRLFLTLSAHKEELQHFILLIQKYNVTVPLHSEFKKRFLDSLEEVYIDIDHFEKLHRNRFIELSKANLQKI